MSEPNPSHPSPAATGALATLGATPASAETVADTLSNGKKARIGGPF
ncbi:hypothetical protein [Variovorax paradoxus]|nr:hypothetical protein [Variovorax paradoxus]